MRATLVFFFAFLFTPGLGCGNSSSDLHAPSGNELERYLAEHPELNDVVEFDEMANQK